MAEAMSAMIGGIILSFIFSWKVALVAVAMTPFMIVGAVIGSKIDQQVNSRGTDEKKTVSSGDLLANDAISNYKTVAGFGLNKVILDEYSDLN